MSEQASLLALMEATDPKDWPTTRGYGYAGPQGLKLKNWMIYVVRQFADRLGVNVALTLDQWRGHEIHKDGNAWRYGDGTLVSEDPTRDCGHCKQPTPANGHDPCIANLPGVVNACCGHGEQSESFVIFANGVALRGFSIHSTEEGESE